MSVRNAFVNHVGDMKTARVVGWLRARFGHEGATLRAVMLMLVVNGGGVLLALAVQLCIARMAGAAAFGRYAYCMAILGIVAVVGKLGYDTATLRFLPSLRADPRSARSFLRRSTRDTLAWSFALAVLGAACGWMLHSWGLMQDELFVTWAVGLPLVTLYAVTYVACASIQALGQPQLAVSMQVIVRPATMLLILSATYVASGAITDRSAMVASVIAAVVTLSAALALSRRYLPAAVAGDTPLPGEESRWRSTSLIMLLITGFDMVINQLDLLLLGALLGTEAAGVYAPAARLALVLQFALNASNAVLAPHMARLYSQGRTVELQGLIRIGALTVAGLSLPLLAGLALFGGQLLQLFGEEFVRAESALQILMLGRLCNALTGIAGYTLLMTNQHRAAAVILGGALLMEAAAGLVLIPLFGIVGAAWTSAIGAALWGAAMVGWCVVRLGLNPTAFVHRSR